MHLHFTFTTLKTIYIYFLGICKGWFFWVKCWCNYGNITNVEVGGYGTWIYGKLAMYHVKIGWKHTKPLTNCNHILFAIYVFTNIWTSHLELFFVYFKYIWLALDFIWSIILKKKTNIEEFECMECICDKIIRVVEFENFNIYFKTKVVNGILKHFFLWCMIFIYIN
jgi:hypothetical protein